MYRLFSLPHLYKIIVSIGKLLIVIIPAILGSGLDSQSRVINSVRIFGHGLVPKIMWGAEAPRASI